MNPGAGCRFLLQGIFWIEPMPPALQADSLLSETPGKPLTPSLFLSPFVLMHETI